MLDPPTNSRSSESSDTKLLSQGRNQLKKANSRRASTYSGVQGST